MDRPEGHRHGGVLTPDPPPALRRVNSGRSRFNEAGGSDLAHQKPAGPECDWLTIWKNFIAG